MGRHINQTFAELDIDYGEELPHIQPIAQFSSQSASIITSYFSDHLLLWIPQYSAIVGCVAWLTRIEILKALNACNFSAVVMQKEDWLRPDSAGKHPAKNPQIQMLYKATNKYERHQVYDLDGLSICGDPTLDRYRVFGFNSPLRKERPVMHHKFLVGGMLHQRDESSFMFEPQSVWLGSWNMTNLSHRNLDTVVILGAGPAGIFYTEWLHIYARSEPLDFSSDYCEPQWRIGT